MTTTVTPTPTSAPAARVSTAGAKRSSGKRRSPTIIVTALLVVVGTAQLPGNPLPDGWSDAEVREAVPHDAFAGKASILALVVVTAACGVTLHRHYRFRARAHIAH